MNNFGEGLLILDKNAEQILFYNRQIDFTAENQFLNNKEDKNEVRESIECIEKEIIHGEACYCTKCNSECGSKENFINHMYN